MQYWTVIDGERRGPMTLEQLIELSIQPTTLVWREGLTDWIEAKDLSELIEIFAIHIPEPPAIPATESKKEPDSTPDDAQESKASQPILPPDPPLGALEDKCPSPPCQESSNSWYPSMNNSCLPCPPSYLALAIITMVCCFQPCGIVSLVYASLVKSTYRQGKYETAKKYSRYAMIWAIVSIVVGLISAPIISVIYLYDHGIF